MKSAWLPIFFSLVVIIASTFVIKTRPQTVIVQSSPPLVQSSTPTSVSNSSDNYYQTDALCGVLPLLPDYSETRFKGIYSRRTWSPSCRFIAWSATIKYSFGPWRASKYEGLFLYDLKTHQVTQIYAPKSEGDSVVFLSWLSDTQLKFHQSLNNTDNVYNISTKTFSTL